MKKFSPQKILVVALLSLLSLTSRALPFVPTTDPSSPTTKWYLIKTENVYLYADANWKQVQTSSTASTTNDYYLWCFVGTESTGYKIYSRGCKAYMKYGFEVDGTGNEVDINRVELGSGNNFYIYYMNPNQKMYLCYDSDNGIYGSYAKYNSYTVSEVAVAPPVDPPFEPTSNPSLTTTQWYQIKIGGMYLTVSANGEAVDVSSSPSNDKNFQWCFVGNASTGYKIYNRGRKAYVVLCVFFGDATEHNVSYTELNSDNSFNIYCYNNGEKLYLDIDSYGLFIAENRSHTCTVVPIDADPSSVVIGDVTDDGKVDIADVNAIINIMLGKDETDAGDVTGDGSVDIADVNEVINIMLGKTSFSSEPTTYTVGGVSFKMMPVLSGTFTMGDNNSTYSEKPAHQVTLGNYNIGQTEVTQALWVAVMGSNPSTFTDDPQCPVESVSWDDCQTFITKLNQMTGKCFRLPTEAEWEYAARGGRFSKGYTYAGGNNLSSVGFYWGNSGPYGNPFGTPQSTHPVAQKAPNELELYDMSGNVSEWCQDWFGYYTSDAQSNPTGPTTGQNRVYRGGSWNDEAGACTVTWRKNNTPSQSNMGLRLAL